MNEPVLSFQVENWLLELLRRYPDLARCRTSILSSYNILKETFLNNGKLLVCGNGGSASDAEHISGELMKGFLKKRPLTPELEERFLKIAVGAENWVHLLQRGLPVIPLTSNGALASAICNDQALDLVFAQQVVGYGKPGDTLLAISTSGNSANVIRAVYTAKALDLKTIGLTGMDGGELKHLCDVVIRVPAAPVYAVQELHLPVYHTLCLMLETEFF